jgi:uncharacterized protein
METQEPDSNVLIDIVREKMPFGKYQGYLFCDLPVNYLEWFSRTGFPAGKLGMLLSTIFEIKQNGLEYLLDPIKKDQRITKFHDDN